MRRLQAPGAATVRARRCPSAACAAPQVEAGHPRQRRRILCASDLTSAATAARLEALEREVRELKELLRQATDPQHGPQTRASPQAPLRPLEAQAELGFGDRRLLGHFDARFHSTSPWVAPPQHTRGAIPRDFRILPQRIILLRHAESAGNVDHDTYKHIPDSQVPLTEQGVRQARDAGRKIKAYIEQREGAGAYRLFMYTSPYKRSLQTYHHLSSAFSADQILGVQEEVQLREQDFGNFQDPSGKLREKADRLRFGRFYYRFDNGESSADVLDRLTVFEDHLVRDINAGRFGGGTNLVIVTHGLALRIFLMKWLHWTVDELLRVYNPPNAEPLILERVPDEEAAPLWGGDVCWVHTKALYRLTQESATLLRGCTDDMRSTGHLPRNRISPFSGGEHECAHVTGRALVEPCEVAQTSIEEQPFGRSMDEPGGPKTSLLAGVMVPGTPSTVHLN